jgi:hypothetical protein
MTRSSLFSLSGESADSIYESIGQQFLDQCTFEADGSISIHGSMTSDHLISALDSLLASKSTRPKSEWLRELKRILQRLRPADYAVHGKRICLALADCIGSQSSDPLPKRVLAKPGPQPPTEYAQFPQWLPTVPRVGH